MKFSKKDNSAICNYCGKWQPTNLTNQQLEEMDWKCDECKAKEVPQVVPAEQDPGDEEISKYHPAYEFLVKLVKVISQAAPEAIPEIKQLAESKPFHTVTDVEYLTTQIWTLATEKYKIPREWLIKKLPKNASLHKEAWPSHGYWIDPNGKVYTVRGAHGGGKTHSDWIRINKNLLIEQYGIFKDLFGPGKQDMYGVECDMMEKGWVKIGDSVSDDARWAVKVNNIKRIPPFIEDFLSQFVPADSILEIGDLNEDIAFIKWPVNNLQKAVNRELMHPATFASLKQADLKEFSNQETKDAVNYITTHGDILHVVVGLAESAQSAPNGEVALASWLKDSLAGMFQEFGIDPTLILWKELAWAFYTSIQMGEDTKRKFQGQPPLVNIDIDKLPTLDKPKKIDELLEQLSTETDPQKKEKIKQHIERIKQAKLLRADLWPSQEETENMITQSPGAIAFGNPKDTSVCGPRPDDVEKTADGEFKGSEFSGTDAAPNPLTDIGPWSSPEDHGAKPQKSPFPNTNWLPADDENLDQQPASNVAASLNKKATDEGYWIDPNGNAFQVRDESTGFITHDQWIFDHRDMLLNDYGIEIKEDALDNLNARDMNNILISKGWTRIGDSPKGDVGIRVTDLRKIPAKVEDVLYSFYTGGKVYIEDLMGKYVAIQGLDTNLQKAVNQSLSRKGSLNKKALQQQDVVDFYLLSLLPPEYLNKEVSPDHYDALTIFKGIIESLRNEYIERGMAELVDEAETTAWTKAIPESDMPEQIKKYYTFHDTPFRGHRDPDDDSDYDSEPEFDYNCSNCGVGLNEDDIFNFDDSYYCESCESEAIQKAIREDVAFCETHKVFVTDKRDLKQYLHGYKFDSWDNHSDPEQHQIVRFDAGKAAWKEMQENAKNQLELFVRERKERTPNPKQLKLPTAGELCPECGTYPCKHNQSSGYPPPVKASLKQAGEGRYLGSDSGWWEAPTDFSDYTAQDFYTIFEYAPWKHMYGGPLWAEIAKTIYQMQQTTDWQKLVVLIDHYHDLGHNSGKLLDKFPEWHKWFKNLLDQKAKKNSLRYLLPRASKPVQSLVTDFLRVHGRDWREDETKKEQELPDTKFHIGEQVIMDRKAGTIKEVSRMDLERPLYVVQFDDGSKSRWAQDDELQPMPAVHSSFNRPFSKKAVLPSKFWIAPDGKEFPMGGVHGHWIENNLKKLKQYGIDTKGKNLTQIWNEMTETGWARVSNEPAGTRFVIEVNDLSNLPPYLDNFIAKYYTQGEEITLGNGKGQYVKVNDPFPNIQKAVNRELMNSKQALLDKKAGSTITLHDELNKSSRVYKNPSSSIVDKLLYPESGEDTLVRGVVDYRTGDIFVWNAYDLPHEVAMQQLGIPINDKTYPDDTFILDEVEGYNWIVNNTPQIMKKQKIKQAAIGGDITNKILQTIHNNGGVTYNLSKGDMSGTPNYSVSIYPDRERIVDGVDFDVLEGFMNDNEDLLKDPENSIGAWTNNGKVYLDIVITTPDQEKAIDLAKQNNQIAIWDLQNAREISTGGTGGGQMPKAFSKKNLIKIAEESLLSQVDQNEIAAASSPAYVIAVNNYAEALKRGHSKDRSLEYAIESVQNLEKVDPKKLVEFINRFVVI